MSRSDRWILILAVIWLAVQISPLWYPTPDSAAYISIARGIAERHVLENHGRAQLYYSIGYPLLLSPLFVIDREPFLLISIMQFGLGLGVIALSYRWVKSIAAPHAAWIAAFTVCTTSFGSIHRRPLTESAFTAALLGSVLILNRTIAMRGWWAIGFGSLMVAATTLIRPAGITLAAGFAVASFHLARRREQSWGRTMAQAILVGLPALCLQLAVMHYDRVQATLDGGLCYADQIREPNLGLGAQFVEGVRLRIQEAGRLLIPGMYKSYAKPGDWFDINLLLYGSLSMALLLGWLRLARERNDVFVWVLPFYAGLYVVWPFDQATRFFTPLTPLLAVCLIMAARSLQNVSVRRVGFGMVAIHLVVAAVYWRFDERPKALAIESERTGLARLSTAVPIRDWKAVVVAEDAEPATIWTPHYLDRLVSIRPITEPLPAEANWLVLRASQLPPSGFASEAIVGRFQLCRRIANPAATTTTNASEPGSGTAETTKLSSAK